MPLPSPAARSISLGILLSTEWRFLLYGMLMSFWSGFGQTFFISLFSAEIRQDLSLSHGDFGSYYAIATTASAITLFWLGKLADTISVPRLSFMTLGGVCLAAMHFSTVGSVLTLTIGIYFLRLSGQGMMYHVYSTAVSRRYIATRGRALAISGFGMNIGEAFFPIFVIIALSVLDWRIIWMLVPLFAFITFAPFMLRLTARTAQQDGPGRTAHNTDEIVQNDISYRRRDVAGDTAFWCVIIWLMMVPGFTITGLFFHQIHIAELKQIPLLIWSSNYIWYALAAVGGAFLAGILIDRYTAQRIAAITQIPMLIAFVFLWQGESVLAIAIFFILFGMAGGMVPTTVSALLAERYGTGWLGEIKALATPLNVFSSALSPALMGIMIDRGASLSDLMMLMIGCCIFSLAMPLIWFNLFGLTHFRKPS